MEAIHACAAELLANPNLAAHTERSEVCGHVRVISFGQERRHPAQLELLARAQPLTICFPNIAIFFYHGRRNMRMAPWSPDWLERDAYVCVDFWVARAWLLPHCVPLARTRARHPIYRRAYAVFLIRI